MVGIVAFISSSKDLSQLVLHFFVFFGLFFEFLNALFELLDAFLGILYEFKELFGVIKADFWQVS